MILKTFPRPQLWNLTLFGPLSESSFWNWTTVKGNAQSLALFYPFRNILILIREELIFENCCCPEKNRMRKSCSAEMWNPFYDNKDKCLANSITVHRRETWANITKPINSTSNRKFETSNINYMSLRCNKILLDRNLYLRSAFQWSLNRGNPLPYWEPQSWPPDGATCIGCDFFSTK